MYRFLGGKLRIDEFEYPLKFEIQAYEPGHPLEVPTVEIYRKKTITHSIRTWCFVDNIPNIEVYRMVDEFGEFYISDTAQYIPDWLRAYGEEVNVSGLTINDVSIPTPLPPRERPLNQTIGSEDMSFTFCIDGESDEVFSTNKGTVQQKAGLGGRSTCCPERDSSSHLQMNDASGGAAQVNFSRSCAIMTDDGSNGHSDKSVNVNQGQREFRDHINQLDCDSMDVIRKIRDWPMGETESQIRQNHTRYDNGTSNGILFPTSLMWINREPASLLANCIDSNEKLSFSGFEDVICDKSTLSSTRKAIVPQEDKCGTEDNFGYRADPVSDVQLVENLITEDESNVQSENRAQSHHERHTSNTVQSSLTYVPTDRQPTDVPTDRANGSSIAYGSCPSKTQQTVLVTNRSCQCDISVERNDGITSDDENNGESLCGVANS